MPTPKGLLSVTQLRQTFEDPDVFRALTIALESTCAARQGVSSIGETLAEGILKNRSLPPTDLTVSIEPVAFQSAVATAALIMADTKLRNTECALGILRLLRTLFDNATEELCTPEQWAVLKRWSIALDQSVPVVKARVDAFDLDKYMTDLRTDIEEAREHYEREEPGEGEAPE